MYAANLFSAVKPLQYAHRFLTLHLPDDCNIACLMSCPGNDRSLVFVVRHRRSQISGSR